MTTSARDVPNANEREVGLATTPTGDYTHLLIDNKPLCPWQEYKTFTPFHGEATKPLCATCEKLAGLLGIDVPTEVSP